MAGGRCVRSLTRELGRKRITASDLRRWRRYYALSVGALRRLGGARDAQLRYVLGSVESLALQGRLTATRMPSVFIQLERNRQYWRKLPFPAVARSGELPRQPDHLHLLPRLRAPVPPTLDLQEGQRPARALRARRARLRPRRSGAAARRDHRRSRSRRSRRFIAWEYLFHFGGGSPPWMSGMAQATAIQALRARGAPCSASRATSRRPARALGAFEAAPPTGVRTTGPRGGVHYLQYSFAPRLFIFNAFLQSLIGLHDFGKLAGDERAHPAVPRGGAGGARGGAAERRGRLVALLLRRRGGDRGLPRADARVPPVDVLPAARRAVLRVRPALPRVPGRPAHPHPRGTRRAPCAASPR